MLGVHYAHAGHVVYAYTFCTTARRATCSSELLAYLLFSFAINLSRMTKVIQYGVKLFITCYPIDVP